jgi:hypothetical protein
MLWVTVGVNDSIIDRLAIHNTGKNKDGYYEYEIVSPFTGERLIEETIWHERSKKYRPLLRKALTLLSKYKVPSTEVYEFFMKEYYGKEKNKN